MQGRNQCSACGDTKPLAEFYDSEVGSGRNRCKPCFRARVHAANKRSGRRSQSYSAEEQAWMATVLRALPSSSLRDLARRPEYTKVARKNAAMVLSVQKMESD